MSEEKIKYPEISNGSAYKLAFSQDLIVYLCGILTYTMNKENTNQLITDVLEQWDKKVEKQTDKLRDINLKQMTDEGLLIDDLDVSTILAKIHSIYPHQLKKEFKEEIKKALDMGLVSMK